MKKLSERLDALASPYAIRKVEDAVELQNIAREVHELEEELDGWKDGLVRTWKYLSERMRTEMREITALADKFYETILIQINKEDYDA